jgi:hypothetical protein
MPFELTEEAPENIEEIFEIIEESVTIELIEPPEKPIFPEIPEQSYEPVELPPYLENLNWLIKPGFLYEWYERQSLHYCFGCDVFIGGGEFILNERTGLPLGNFHGAHGGGRLPWIYDPVLDLMGLPGSAYGGQLMQLFPRSEFALHFPLAADSIKVVMSIDSTMRNEHWDEELSTEAYGMTAVAVGNVFITDFIYNDISKNDGLWARQGREAIDKIEVVDEHGKHGIIGSDGSVVLPFEFDEVLLIDKWSAFVKYGERWGIVGFYDYIPNFMPSGENYIEGDNVNEEWFVVYDYASFSLQNKDGIRFFDLGFEMLTNSGGRNIRGFRNNGSDVYFMNAKNNSLTLNQIRLHRDWAGEIVIYLHFSDFLDGGLLTAVNEIEKIAEMARDSARESGYEVASAYSVQVNKSPHNIISDDALKIYFSGSIDGVYVESFLFEAVRNESGEWEVYNITGDVWE